MALCISICIFISYADVIQISEMVLNVIYSFQDIFLIFQILYERNRLSLNALQLLKTSFSSIMKEALTPETEFWSANKTLTFLAEEKYFAEEGGIAWPSAIKNFINKGTYVVCNRKAE